MQQQESVQGKGHGPKQAQLITLHLQRRGGEDKYEDTHAQLDFQTTVVHS